MSTPTQPIHQITQSTSILKATAGIDTATSQVVSFRPQQLLVFSPDKWRLLLELLNSTAEKDIVEWGEWQVFIDRMTEKELKRTAFNAPAEYLLEFEILFDDRTYPNGRHVDLLRIVGVEGIEVHIINIYVPSEQILWVQDLTELMEFVTEKSKLFFGYMSQWQMTNEMVVAINSHKYRLVVEKSNLQIPK